MRANRAIKCLLFLITVLTVFPATQKSAAQGAHQSVGLVLSGGGAKGIAHIGAIKALEDNGIPIDFITGTSMGAIVGGLYACGYTPEEMLALMTSRYFLDMSTGSYDPSLTYYFSRPAPSPQMFSMSFGEKGGDPASTFYNPQSLISPTPMAFGFMELFSAYTAQCGGDFDRLFVPFRCVASNISERRSEVMGSGDVGESIRASMSFPLVFQAVKRGGDILYDGGIYDNFPVNVMERSFSPGVMIGVDVSAPTDTDPVSFLDQLDFLMSQPQSYDIPADKGVRIRVKLSEFSLLDFAKAREIYEIGYRRAIEMMDTIRARVPQRRSAADIAVRRAVFKANTPHLRFDKVEVSGGTKAQNDYIAYLFTPSHGADTIGVDHARLAFYRALSSGKIGTLIPHARRDSTGYFTLGLDAAIKKKYTVGAGGCITSSNNSFLYANVGYSSLSFSSVSTGLEIWLGQSYLAATVRADLHLPTPFPSAFRILGVASRRRYYESEKLFYRDNEPAFVSKHQYFGSLAWAMAAGRTAEVQVGVSGGRLYNSFYRNVADASVPVKEHLALDLGKTFVAYESSTLNDFNYPTAGYMRRAAAEGFYGRARTYLTAGTNSDTQLWGQLTLDMRHYLDLSKHWSLGIEGRAVVSTRKLLSDYYSAITSAPSFEPTPASKNVFDSRFRANSFVAAGLVPVYKLSSNLSARLNLDAFVPFRRIIETPEGTARYGRWFGSAEFFGELDLVLKLPFATLSGYCNYATSHNHVNAGIALGVYLFAPTF